MTDSIRDVRFFVAAYEEGSFTAAAAREGATQSGVSQHIRKLEARLGVKLFLRYKIGITATSAAHTYYNRCVELLRLHESTHRMLEGYARGLEGMFRAGFVPSMTRCVLAPALASFVQSHPNVTVQIIEANSAVLTRHVKAGELEFAVVPAFAETAGLRNRLLMRTPELLVSRRSQAKIPSGVRLASLDHLDLIVPTMDNVRRRLLDAYIATNGVRINRLLELDAMHGVLSLIAQSDWVAILPGIMMSDPNDRRIYDLRPLFDPPLILDLTLIEASRRSVSRPAEVFLDFVVKEMDRLNRDGLATNSVALADV